MNGMRDIEWEDVGEALDFTERSGHEGQGSFVPQRHRAIRTQHRVYLLHHVSPILLPGRREGIEEQSVPGGAWLELPGDEVGREDPI